MSAPEPRAVRLLAHDLRDQIAAGEVVERPASVVKELVENAFDADARSVRVEIDGGGLDRIAVIDDGHGMSNADALLAIERHATSKIERFDDLFALTSFGFRGEALPSIASVSRFVLTTRRAQALEATQVSVVGGAEAVLREVGGPAGTSIEVRDLFFNVPARRKFLKSVATEAGQVTDVFFELGLARPEVAMTLVRDGRIARQLLRATDRTTRAREAFGRGAEELVAIVAERPRVRIEALLASPDRGRTGATGLHLLVNNRVIRDRALARAIAMAYGNALDAGRYPIGVVFLDVPPADVDVNVHPQKAEVRFSRGRELYDDVTRALGPSLANARVRPAPHDASFLDSAAGSRIFPTRAPLDVSGAEQKPPPLLTHPRGAGMPAEQQNLRELDIGASADGSQRPFLPSPSGAEQKPPPLLTHPRGAGMPAEQQNLRELDLGATADGSQAAGSAGGNGRTFLPSPSPPTRAAVDTLVGPGILELAHAMARMNGPAPARDGDRRSDDGSRDRRSPRAVAGIRDLFPESTLAPEDDPFPGVAPAPLPPPKANVVGRSVAVDPLVALRIDPTTTLVSVDAQTANALGEIARSALGTPSKGRYGSLRFLAQVRSTFLVCEGAEGILILDQHAAAERVTLERLRRAVASGAVERRTLVAPEVVDLTSAEAARADEARDELLTFGLDARRIGDTRVALHGVPALLKHARPEQLLRDLVDALQRAGAPRLGPAAPAALATMACHGSLPAGDPLRADACTALLRALDDVDFAVACPHGKPIISVVSFFDLEKKVGRK